MKRARKFPRRGMQNNDIQIHCPSCHKPIIIFAGFRKRHVCYLCGHKFNDRLWKENNAYYKDRKREVDDCEYECKQQEKNLNFPF